MTTIGISFDTLMQKYCMLRRRIEQSFTRLLSRKMSDPIVPTPDFEQLANSAATRTVYLIHRSLGKYHSQAEFNRVFHSELLLPGEIYQSPVFFNKADALSHLLFLSNEQAVIRVLVPDQAISGQHGHLILKTAFVNKTVVHGCYPRWATGRAYFMNPAFDQRQAELLHDDFVYADQE